VRVAYRSTGDSHGPEAVFYQGRAHGTRQTAQIRRDIVKIVSQITSAPRFSPYHRMSRSSSLPDTYVMKYVRFSSSIARLTLLTTTCVGTCKINGEKLRIAWMPASTS
jgi:hypothetical protein